MTISKAFFEIALQNINDNNSFLQIYLLIYFGQFPSKEYLSTMSQIFTYSSEINILNDLVQILLKEYRPNMHSKSYDSIENLFDENCFFNENDRQNAPSLFQPFLFSTVDYAVLDFISGITDTFNFPTSYSIFNVFHENEKIEESIHNIDELTMSNDSLQVKAALRHLLQLCDTIPVFQKVPDGLTVEDFFNTYLVSPKHRPCWSNVFSIKIGHFTFLLPRNRPHCKYGRKSPSMVLVNRSPKIHKHVPSSVSKRQRPPSIGDQKWIHFRVN